MGLHQQLSQGKVGSAHTEHQSLWDVKRVFGTPSACKTGTGMGHWLRSPQLPLEEAMDQHSKQRDNGETGHKRGQAAATLLCRLHHCLTFTPHCPQEDTGWWAQGLCRYQEGNEWCSQCDKTWYELCHTADGSLERSSLSLCLQHEPRWQMLIHATSSGPA